MTTFLSIKKVIAAALGLSLLVPALVLAHEGHDHEAIAQAGATVNTTAQVTTPGARVNARASITASTTAETTRAARAKEKAAQEIDRRIASLEALVARVKAMNKVNADLKANVENNVKMQIDAFTALKAKIEADTDLATLKTDIKSITDSYRGYMLVIPQTHITAAADRMATIINMMASVGTKLQARINSAKSAGAVTTELEAALTDLAAKLNSAQVHAQTAITLIAPLTPDNGDDAVRDANHATIKKAQAEIKAGHADLVAARKDITTIVKGLATLKVNANASSSVQTQ